MSDYRYISTAELAQAYQQDKDLCLIDVRTPAEFGGSHVSWAENFPLDKIEKADIDAWLCKKGLAESDSIYVICQRGQRSAMAVEQLQKKIGNTLIIVEGGLDACPASLLQQGKSRVISLERQVRIAAGSLVLMGVVVGSFFHAGFYGLSAFVGAGLIFAGVTDTCGMGLMLARMPWNRG